MKKIPTKILKATKEAQQQWVANELKLTEDYATELRKFSRSLIYGNKFTPRVDLRPDENKELEPEAFAD
jgi:hypothetical protein